MFFLHDRIAKSHLSSKIRLEIKETFLQIKVKSESSCLFEIYVNDLESVKMLSGWYDVEIAFIQ